MIVRAISAALLLNCIAVAAQAMELRSGASALSAEYAASVAKSVRRPPLTAFTVRNADISVHAVTRRGRADTALRRAHLREAVCMSKVMPGYPQPAIVSLDFRLEF